MDQRLYDAARTGNVSALHALLNEDPLILEKLCLARFVETPLHVAVLAGKIEFAKEIIRLMPCFAMELNKDGFAPMHLASARGHVEMVMELLNLDTDCSLCRQRDRSGQIPLHYATARGRIPVIEKLIFHCPESLQEETADGETVLHLAVKNYQLGALKVVLGRLKWLESFQTLLSKKDYNDRGKTIVELAVATKQVQVLELLKEYQNASAKSPGNDEITELPAEKQAEQHQIEILSSDPETDGKQNEKQESKEEGKKPSKFDFDLHNLVLVAAVLVATVTYQAQVTPPSSIWEKGANLKARCILKFYPSLQEDRRYCPADLYYVFMTLNTAGFFSSVILMMIVTLSHQTFPVQLLSVCILLLLGNYMVLMMGLSPSNSSLYIVSLVALVIVILLFCSIILLRKLWLKILKSRVLRLLTEAE